MFFINREYGKLIKKDNLNGSIVYTIENSKGKAQTISFHNDVCPTANIGDEIFFIYNRNAFSDTKKGIFLSADLKEATVFNRKFLSVLDINFWKELLGFTTKSVIFMTSSAFLFSYGIAFILHALGIQHIGAFGVLGFKVGLFASITLPGISVLMKFLKNIDTFAKLSQQRDKYFRPYKKANFNKKDILFNKTLDEDEKTRLTMFVRGIDGLSSTEKLEIYKYIDEQKKMNVNDIGYLDILNVSNKLKMKKQVEQLLLK